jgi:hypothetical protein
MSKLSCDAATLVTWVNGLLAAQAKPAVRSIALARVGEQVRLTLVGVQTGLSVFGMTVPPLDVDLLLRGTWANGKLALVWEAEAVRGIPPMAAKLVGKPALAKLLLQALGARWGLDRALTADPTGDLALDPALLRIPGWERLQVAGAAVPDGDAYVLSVEFGWN